MDPKTPDVVTQALATADELVAKGISTSNLSGGTYSSTGLIKPLNLSPLLTDLSERPAPLYQMLSRPQGVGEGAYFNLVSELFNTGENADPKEAFYADGGVPVERATKYTNIFSPYRDAGYKGSVTGRAMRQMRIQEDLEALEVKKTMRRLMQAIEWLTFYSRDDVTNTAGITGYKGYDQLITTVVIDAAGATITKGLIDQACKAIAYYGGAGAGQQIFCSYGVSIDLDNIFNTKEQINVNLGSTTDLTLGNHVKVVRTVIGDLPINPDYFINPGNPYPQGNSYSASSGPTGVAKSTVYILPTPFMEYQELLPMSKVDLAVVADKHDFMVIESGAPTLRAEPWAAKIINVKDSLT